MRPAADMASGRLFFESASSFDRRRGASFQRSLRSGNSRARPRRVHIRPSSTAPARNCKNFGVNRSVDRALPFLELQNGLVGI